MVSRRDIVGGCIALVAAVASAVLAPELPAEMAVHFDPSGTPDRYFARPLALSFGPALAAGIAVLFAVLPRIDPLGENVAAFQRAYDAVAVATVAFVAYVHGLVLAFNLGVAVDVTVALAPALAVVYYLLGRLLERAERNWFVGLRTPWTLSDERVWERTHDRVAVLFKLAGVLALGALVTPSFALFWFVGPVLVAAVAGVVYSFVSYRDLHPA